MKSPLLSSIDGWLASRAGHIPFYQFTFEGKVLLGHTGDIDYLVETANNYLGKNDFEKMSYIPFEHVFGYSLGVWMGRFMETGFDSQMLKDLRNELHGIRFFHTLNPAIPTRGEPLPHWEHTADMEDFNDPGTTAAFAFAKQLTLDGFSRLKRCRVSSCQKFFLGRPDGKWCSKACGSKHRVNKKRRKDRLN